MSNSRQLTFAALRRVKPPRHLVDLDPGERRVAVTASGPDVERAFVTVLAAYGIPVTVRTPRGRDVDGTCGQLAAQDAYDLPALVVKGE